MDDFFGLIIFVVIFLLGPLLEQIRRKQQRPPGQNMPRPQIPQDRPQPESQSQAERGGSRTEEVSAATMLPDELWEVLTGQPRPRPLPAPVPAPDIDDEEVVDEEDLIVEDVQIETRRNQWEEGISLERTTRHEVPVVVSLETTPAVPAARHAAFHKRLDTSAQPALVVRTATMPWLRGRKALRQAMLIQAVLGKPKALE